ncbi:MAG: methionine ABC transporter permease [Clostridium sp. SCN 57-10]|nr:MAG: methionine ABC transporter permease [Clostridium sp. SCN 57-10]
MFSNEMLCLFGVGFLESLYMTLLSTAAAYAIGLPLGLLLVATETGSVWPRPALNRVLGVVINCLRSVPFLILLVAVIPITRFIVGTTIGSMATVVPLVIAAAPFLARMVESSVKEVDRGVIEAALSMGASPLQIVCKVLLPEALPSLLIGAAIAVTTILGYSAMAGIVGGGGLGAIAINYGYYRKQTSVMLVMIVLLVLIVQLFQEIGNRAARKMDKRIR